MTKSPVPSVASAATSVRSPRTTPAKTPTRQGRASSRTWHMSPMLSWPFRGLRLQEVAGDIKKASAETMKARRVVRARRPAPVSDPAPAGANPFAGFSLLQPQAAAAAPAASTAIKVLMARRQQKHCLPPCCVYSGSCVAGAGSGASLHAHFGHRAYQWPCRAKVDAACQVHRLHQGHHDHTRSRGGATRCHSRHGSSCRRDGSIHHTSTDNGCNFRTSAHIHSRSSRASCGAFACAVHCSEPASAQHKQHARLWRLWRSGQAWGRVQLDIRRYTPVCSMERVGVGVRMYAAYSLCRSIVWHLMLDGCADMKQDACRHHRLDRLWWLWRSVLCSRLCTEWLCLNRTSVRLRLHRPARWVQVLVRYAAIAGCLWWPAEHWAEDRWEICSVVARCRSAIAALMYA